MASAAFSGTNYAKRVAATISTWPNAEKCNGRVYCMSDECFATSTGGAGSLMYAGGLPRGANVLCTVIWPIDTATFGTGDALASAATGQLGIIGDVDLFGDVADLNASALPQVIESGPDGTTYTTTLDFALKDETSPVMLTAAQNVVDTEGIAVKMLYTIGGRTS